MRLTKKTAQNGQLHPPPQQDQNSQTAAATPPPPQQDQNNQTKAAATPTVHQTAGENQHRPAFTLPFRPAPAYNIAKMQAETRRRQHFPETESALGAEARLKRKKHPALSPLPSVQGLLSHLGTFNPVASPVRSDDVLWLFDNIAYAAVPGSGITRWVPAAASLPWPLSKIGAAAGTALGSRLETTLGRFGGGDNGTRPAAWNAEFVAAVFEHDEACSIVDVVAEIAERVGLADDAGERDTIEERLRPFVMDVRPARRIRVLHGGTELKLGPTGAGGMAANGLGIAPGADGDCVVHGQGIVPPGTRGVLGMKTFFAEPDGWGVISDIDDTIKITQTSDPIGILRSTFVDEPTPIAGMPELYATVYALMRSVSYDEQRQQQPQSNPPYAPFFYLSASPYNLYPFLRGFRDAHFPPGQLLLRDSSWKTVAGLLSALTVGTQEYKVGQMRRVRSWFPRRKIMLVGDSTQSDPEAYGQMYREHPGWIRLILIRRATDIAAVGITSKNEPGRFEKAFRGVPGEVWHVFEDPAECMPLIEAAIRRG